MKLFYNDNLLLMSLLCNYRATVPYIFIRIPTEEIYGYYVYFSGIIFIIHVQNPYPVFQCNDIFRAFSHCQKLFCQFVAFTEVYIISISGNENISGTLLIENDKIPAIGPSDEVDIPDGARVMPLPGKVIMPGPVDSHSHIGNGDD